MFDDILFTIDKDIIKKIIDNILLLNIGNFNDIITRTYIEVNITKSIIKLGLKNFNVICDSSNNKGEYIDKGWLVVNFFHDSIGEICRRIEPIPGKFFQGQCVDHKEKENE